MTELTPCPRCAELHFAGATTCPHCAAPLPEAASARPLPLLLLGLTLAGCGEKDDDTGDTAEEPLPEPEYGVPATPQPPSAGAEGG